MTKPPTIVPAPKLALQAPPADQPPAVAVAELKRTEPIATAKVYPASIAKAILAVTRAVGHVAKNGENEFQRYAYVKWDDIAEKLSPLLADHGLILVQTEKSRHLIEQTDKGSTLSIVYGFCFTNEDGEVWPEVEWTALARLRDQKGITDDKAAAKCHTQAEKYFCIKQFKIRTGDAIDSDADGADHQANQRREAGPRILKKDTLAAYHTLQREMDTAATSIDSLNRWGRAAAPRVRTLPADWQTTMSALYQGKLSALKSGRAPMDCGDMLTLRASGGVIWEDDGVRDATDDDMIDESDRDGVPAFLDRRARI